MDTALHQKIPFILDRNLAKANCTGNRVCTSCDTLVLGEQAFPFNLFSYTFGIFIFKFMEREDPPTFPVFLGSSTARPSETIDNVFPNRPVTVS